MVLSTAGTAENLVVVVRCDLPHLVEKMRGGWAEKYLKGRKTSSEESFKKRRDSNRARFRRERPDNLQRRIGDMIEESGFAKQ